MLSSVSTFEFKGSTVLHHRHPAGHPLLLECMESPPPTERCVLTLAAAPPLTAAARDPHHAQGVVST